MVIRGTTGAKFYQLPPQKEKISIEIGSSNKCLRINSILHQPHLIIAGYESSGLVSSTVTYAGLESEISTPFNPFSRQNAFL